MARTDAKQATKRGRDLIEEARRMAAGIDTRELRTWFDRRRKELTHQVEHLVQESAAQEALAKAIENVRHLPDALDSKQVHELQKRQQQLLRQARQMNEQLQELAYQNLARRHDERRPWWQRLGGGMQRVLIVAGIIQIAIGIRSLLRVPEVQRQLKRGQQTAMAQAGSVLPQFQRTFRRGGQTQPFKTPIAWATAARRRVRRTAT